MDTGQKQDQTKESEQEQILMTGKLYKMSLSMSNEDRKRKQHQQTQGYGQKESAPKKGQLHNLNNKAEKEHKQGTEI